MGLLTPEIVERAARALSEYWKEKGTIQAPECFRKEARVALEAVIPSLIEPLKAEIAELEKRLEAAEDSWRDEQP